MSDTELGYLKEYYRLAHGKVLSADTIKKWRQREKLEARVYEACEWLTAHANIAPDIAQDAENVVVAMRDALRDRKRMDTVKRSLRFGPMSELDRRTA